eukprot:10157516-Lingulodinium_polyedra.AAC.1
MVERLLRFFHGAERKRAFDARFSFSDVDAGEAMLPRLGPAQGTRGVWFVRGGGERASSSA